MIMVVHMPGSLADCAVALLARAERSWATEIYFYFPHEVTPWISDRLQAADTETEKLKSSTLKHLLQDSVQSAGLNRGL